MTTPEERAVAFEVAVRELVCAYPPAWPPTTTATPSSSVQSVPSSTAYAQNIWNGQVKAYEKLVVAASDGDLQLVRMWRLHTRIPEETLEAMIALIYG
jgi:hypothetical protein